MRRHLATAPRLLALLAVLGSALVPTAAAAATREPLSASSTRSQQGVPDAAARPSARALTAAQRDAAELADRQFRISSSAYGADVTEPLAATLRGLEHGPELALLSVYVATPAEISATCGATVIACYLPGKMEMVVSGVDRAIAGVPREFAIAHEYGHHIANSQRSDLSPAIESGTIRWATYERVCQYTRASKLFPGDQGAHYWQNPEEAFAQSYAHLNEPGSRVSWQYTSLLQPSTASLAKIETDVASPWQGPTSSTLHGTLTAPGSAGRVATAAGSNPAAGLAGAAVVGTPPWVVVREIPTPLDGTVSVSLQAPEGASLAVALRKERGGAPLARALTGLGGSAAISYDNCGNEGLDLEVRSLAGSGSFRAEVVKP